MVKLIIPPNNLRLDMLAATTHKRNRTNIKITVIYAGKHRVTKYYEWYGDHQSERWHKGIT